MAERAPTAAHRGASAGSHGAPAAALSAQRRRRALLEGPVVPTMLRLAAPTMVVLVVQTLVGLAETYFVSFLGTEALAGVTLVFPVLMLTQMMANGAFGGGVASAIARALGAGRKEDADALVFHALVLGLAMGLVFTAGELLGGRLLYRALGGEGAVLAASLAYADIVFAGAALLWIVSLLAAALRGSGNVIVPAAVTLSGAGPLLLLSPALIFGWGPLPRLGVAGAGTAVVAYYLLAAIALAWYLRSGRGVLRLPLDLRRLDRRLLLDILRVGGLSAVGTIQANLTVVLVTGAVGLFGAKTIAGYGIASRLDYVLIPLLFALGTAAVTMVGTNIGAGQVARARRVAWVGAALAAGLTETIGLAAALFPHAWIGIFSGDPAVQATGALYLRLVAPCYGFFGAGMLLYFSGQGAGRVLWPVLAGTLRMAMAAGLGWLAVAGFGAGLSPLFALVAGASILFGAMNVAAMLLGRWERDPAPAPMPPAVAAPQPETAD
jgi:putative MATE family efflux protein